MLIKLLFTLLILGGCFMVFWSTRWIWFTARSRRREKMPQKPTMFDVRRLLQSGKKDEALCLYVKIFKMDVTQARKEVEELERSLTV